jgi:UDP-N-acetylglucosamine 1-carboxyvinyltransferase
MLEDKTINLSSNLTPSHSLSETTSPVLEIWGQAPLKGEVQISGAKNSALAIMAGALLCQEDCRLRNLPSLVDITRMSQLLASLGVKLQRNGDLLDLNARNIERSEAPYDIVSQMRASFDVIGPLLARLGEARVPLPGGCAIGARPVDLYLQGLQAMGANIQIESGVVHASVTNKNGRLKGAKIYLNYPSVGATKTILTAATLAYGETIIENAAQEPEIVDLANFCRQMGAKIRGDGTKTIEISGVDRLNAVDYAIIPDRIEAGTFMVAGAITSSEISLVKVTPEHLAPVIAKLQQIGVQILIEDRDRLRVIPGREIRAVDIKTLPYPGFPTDMQAQFMALLSISEGNSVIGETVFENRLRHAAELQRMGADIRIEGNIAVVCGVPFLSGTTVMATDLRASAALVLAGLAAKGKTTISGLHHLDRGYDNIEAKLHKLGAKLQRVNSSATVPQDSVTSA